MKTQIINTIVTFVVTGGLGYCVSTIKNMNQKKQEKEDKILKEIESIKAKQEMMESNELLEMRNDLSNKFFVYDTMEEVEDYLVMSFREKCERYFDMDGDSWIHPMYDKSFEWKIKPTGYLK